MNYILEYRESIVKAKRAWDANKQKKGKVIEPGSPTGINSKVSSKLSRLGIYGGGIAILSKAEDKPFLLYSPDVQKHFNINDDMSEYEYLNTPYEICWVDKSYRNFIDLLFFVSRDTKYPEYVKNIKDDNHQNPFEYPFQFKLRQDYEILHCSAGEILFFSLLWRIIIELIVKNNDTNKKYNKTLFSSTNSNPNWFLVFGKSKANLVEKILVDKLIRAGSLKPKDLIKKNKIINSSALAAAKYFNDSLKCETSVKYIFTELDVFNPKSLTELNKYVQYLFSGSVSELTENNSDNFADEIILAFAKKIGLTANTGTLKNLLNKLHKNARFPILPYYFLMQFDTQHELKEHIVFPLWYTFSEDTKYEYEKSKWESAVLHALYSIKSIWTIEEFQCENWYTNNNTVTGTEVQDCFKKYLSELFSLFSAMSKPIIDKEYYAKQRKNDIGIIAKQATKAAISQVMARNMSHNIGSHVLSKMIKWDFIQTVEKSYQSSLYFPDKLDVDSADEAKYLKDFVKPQIEYFNSYLKTRMDFLADIATSTPTIQNIKQFKGELLHGFDYNRLLLNKISGINGFNFTIKVYKDGSELTNNDFPVSISNDVLGYHAFYIILENIIRNTAKHSYAENNKKGKKGYDRNGIIEKVIFKIDVSDTDDEDKSFYKITISDNCPLIGTIPLQPDELKKYKPILATIGNKVPKIRKLVFDQNTRLNKSILDEETNSLRQGAWGLIEMDVSAAYLRKIEQESVDEDKYQIPLSPKEEKEFAHDKMKEKLRILEATIVDKKYLGYQFYIPKPKELLIIDESGKTWNELFANNLKGLNDWKNEGILFLKANTDDKDKWKFKTAISYPHEIVLFINSKNVIESPLISKRTITFEELNRSYSAFQAQTKSLGERKTRIDFTSILKSELITEAWRAWVVKRRKLKDIHTIESDVTYDNFLPQIEQGKSSYHLILNPHGESYDGVTQGEYNEVFPKSQFEHLVKIIKKTEPQLKQENEKLKFIDNALTNVLVLDERIQEIVLKERYYPENNITLLNGIVFKELWDNVNVYVPQKTEINLSKKNFSKDYTSKIVKIINEKFIEGKRVKLAENGKVKDTDIRTCKGVDFIVIHLGVIEKILKGRKNDKKDETEINKFISEILKSRKNTTIIVTSGRGKPDNLPKDVPYLGYSIISQYLIENRFKSLFTQTLYSARPQNR